MQKYTIRYGRAFLYLCFAAIASSGVQSVYAQQRPLLTEDARLIPAGSVELETGFTYEDQAVYTISGLEGTHIALLPSGVHFGLGDRAEFQMTGTIQDYLKPADNTWHNDFGDISLSTKMKIASESGKIPHYDRAPQRESSQRTWTQHHSLFRKRSHGQDHQEIVPLWKHRAWHHGRPHHCR